MALDYLSHIRAESARFRAVLGSTDQAARVPPCPDWDAADLLYHLAEVQSFWGTIVRERVDDPEPLDELQRPRGTRRRSSSSTPPARRWSTRWKPRPTTPPCGPGSAPTRVSASCGGGRPTRG